LNIIRPDLYKDRKCIHVMISKEDFAEFRALMFKFGVSMQDAYGAFARSVIENGTGVKIIEALVRKKLKEAIEREITHAKKPLIKKITEYDHETLYDIINSSEDEENEFERELETLENTTTQEKLTNECTK